MKFGRIKRRLAFVAALMAGSAVLVAQQLNSAAHGSTTAGFDLCRALLMTWATSCVVAPVVVEFYIHPEEFYEVISDFFFLNSR